MAIKQIKKRKKANDRKPLILLLSLVVALSCIVGMTYAYLTSTTPNVENTMMPAKTKITVEEDFDGTTKTNVKVKNSEGDEYTDVYVRVMLICNWYFNQDGSSQIVGKPTWTITDTANALDLNTTDWFVGSDGFYYYKKVLSPGSESSNLINSIKLLKDTSDNTYQGLEIIAECIQAKGITSTGVPAVQDAWPAVKVNNNNELEKATP